jgi:hypothetical protein
LSAIHDNCLERGRQRVFGRDLQGARCRPLHEEKRLCRLLPAQVAVQCSASKKTCSQHGSEGGDGIRLSFHARDLPHPCVNSWILLPNRNGLHHRDWCL